MKETLTLLKKATLSAVIGHGAALLFLFLASAALQKNEDPSSLLSVVALVALFFGAAVSGIFSAKLTPAMLGSVLTGALFSGILGMISLVFSAILPATDTSDSSEYGLGFKIGMLLGAALLSALISLMLKLKKNSRKTTAKHRKKALGR